MHVLTPNLWTCSCCEHFWLNIAGEEEDIKENVLEKENATSNEVCPISHDWSKITEEELTVKKRNTIFDVNIKKPK